MTVVRVEEHDFSLKLETFKLAEDLFVSSFGHSKATEGKSSNLTPQPVTQDICLTIVFSRHSVSVQNKYGTEVYHIQVLKPM